MDLSSMDDMNSQLCLKVELSSTDINKTPKFCGGELSFGDLSSDEGSVVKGRAWYDANENGIQEEGEVGIYGVEAELFNSSNSSMGVVSSDNLGFYEFPPVPSGSYLVKITPPSTFSFSPSGKGTESTDSDVTDRVNGKTSSFDLDENVEKDHVDVGLYVSGKKLASLKGLAWYDADENDRRSVEELGIPGVEVELLDKDSGLTLSTDVTGADGSYRFEGVRPGKYELKYTPPWSGYSLVQLDSGNDDSVDSDVSASGKIEDIVVSTSGEISISGDKSEGLNLDAGYSSTQSLSSSVKGRVWLDEDKDGIQGSKERTLSGVPVSIYREIAPGSFKFLAEVLTGSSGEYDFKHLPPVSFKVRVLPRQYSSVASSYLLTKKDAGGDDSVDSDVDENTYESELLDLSSGSSQQVVDAGFKLSSEVKTSSLGDYVWIDSNRDGIQDSSEEGMSLLLSLYDSEGRVLSSTVSDSSSGLYKFSSLLPGQYKIGAKLPADSDYVFTMQDASEDDSEDSDVSSSGMTGILNLSSGEENLSVDVGLSPVGGLYLESRFIIPWDGRCSDEGSRFDCIIGNYPSLYNRCNSAVGVEVDFYSNGSLSDSQLFKISPSGVLVLNAHDFKGFSRELDGLFEVNSSDPGCLYGNLETLFWENFSGLIFGYNSSEVSPLTKGECWLPLNTFNPNLVAGDLSISTKNVLKIANGDSSEEEFVVNYHNYLESASLPSEKLNIRGKSVRKETISVSDIYGLVSISPSNPLNGGYTAYMHRYGRDRTTMSGERLNAFSIVNSCLSLNNKTKILPLTAQSYRLSWIELSNPTSTERSVKVGIHSDHRGLVESKEVLLEANDSVHLPVFKSLDSGENGYGIVESEGDFIAASTVYFYGPNFPLISPFGGDEFLLKNRVTAAQTVFGLSKLFLGKNSVQYNTHLGNNGMERYNWLRIFNNSDDSVELILLRHSPSSEESLKVKLSVPPSKGRRYNLNDLLDLPVQETGVIEIQNDSSEELYGDLIRIDYWDSNFVNISESEGIPIR